MAGTGLAASEGSGMEVVRTGAVCGTGERGQRTRDERAMGIVGTDWTVPRASGSLKVW